MISRIPSSLDNFETMATKGKEESSFDPPRPKKLEKKTKKVEVEE